MSRTRKFLIVAGGIIASPLVLVALWIGYALVHGTILQLMGYPVDVPPYELAEQIAATGGDPLRCRQLQQSVPTMGPSLAEKRMSCFYHLAKLTKDPEVCELLMPSSYGLSCVGAAMTVRDLCSMGQTDVAWGGGTTSYADCRYDDPRRKLRANQCCLIARVAFVRSENDCSPLEPYPELRDECLDSLAFKSGDPDVCDPITQENLKVACIVKARAMHADPSICQGCKERVDNLNSFR